MGHADLEETLYWQWQICMRWIVKLKWNPTIVIPDRPEFNILKPQSEVLLAMLNLCTELHVVGFGNEFQNAGIWFRECGREFQWTRRRDFYMGSENLEGKGSKSKIARTIQHTQKIKNPFIKEEMPLWHNVAQTVLDHRLDNRKDFVIIYDDLYRGSQRKKPRGLGSAFSAWATSYDRGPTLSFCLDTQLNQLRQDDEGNPITNGRDGYAILKLKDSQQEK